MTIFMMITGLEPLGGFVNLPVGRLRLFLRGISIKGARAVFAVMDQTEVWNQRNGGVKLAELCVLTQLKLAELQWDA